MQDYDSTERGKHCIFHGSRLLLTGPEIEQLGGKVVDDTHVAAKVFAAANLRKLGRFPDRTADELWIADIKACGSAGQCRVFTDVMFVESIGAVFIFGIELEDGRPLGVKTELAERQQLFIDFLREQNEISDLAMGGLRAIFQGSEYAAEAMATAAYMIHREHLTDLALGYRNREGEYVCEKFEHEQRFLEGARATLPFDELPR
ncbi:hypothetical protein [Pseudomonas poae]|uniref:hypothetical protein n=1 Tax=Pseudomonas poae TaxID=200451 RepID=UPI0030CBC378